VVRVRVDFNSRGPRGTVRASLRRADGPVRLGDTVVAYDPHEDDMAFEATVASIDESGGRVLLDVMWQPVRRFHFVNLHATPVPRATAREFSDEIRNVVDHLSGQVKGRLQWPTASIEKRPSSDLGFGPVRRFLEGVS